jgi:ABC-type nitrate/sulfonate/bicarbonate transport system substrate-binding protein
MQSKRFKTSFLALAVASLFALVFTGCNKDDGSGGNGPASAKSGGTPTFILGWSEYPSSSTFGVAKDQGVIDRLAKKWNINVELKQTDYDTLVTMYGSGQADAVCITSLDTLSPALGRPAVHLLPVSSSKGADACVVAGVNTVQDLKGKKTYGLEKSVAQYVFERNLELLKLDPKEYPFSNMDPAAAAQAMQTNQNDIHSVMIWNPFLMQTLKTRKDAKVLFSSDTLPNEVVDVVVAGKDSLAKDGGERFGAFVCDVYYEMMRRLNEDKTKKDTTVALGAKFSNLNYEEMTEALKATHFYTTPDEAIKLLGSDDFRNKINPRLVEWAANHGVVAQKPTVGFDDQNAQVNFSTKYIKLAQSKQ